MRNELLNLFKFILILLVCFHHTAWWNNLNHGYIAVEFFFMVSGYFLFQAYNAKGMSLIDYFRHRLLRVYPTYFIVLIVYLLFSIVFYQFYNEYNKVNWILSALRDLTLLQSVGLNIFDVASVRFNPPDWYISAFFWSSMIIYWLLKFKNVYKIILTVLVLCVYSFYFIFNERGLDEIWCYVNIFYMPLWRALAGISLGVLLGGLLQNILIKEFLLKYKLVFNLITIGSIITICFCIITPKDFDWLCCLCFLCVLLNILSPKGLGCYFNNNRYLKIVPDISFEILLIHQMLIPVTVKMLSLLGVSEIHFLKYISYVCIVIVVAYALQKIVVPSFNQLIKNKMLCQ